MGVTEEKKGKAAGCSGETVGRKNMGETAGAMNETEKAYIHWLYQAAGFGSRRFCAPCRLSERPGKFIR